MKKLLLILPVFLLAGCFSDNIAVDNHIMEQEQAKQEIQKMGATRSPELECMRYEDDMRQYEICLSWAKGEDIESVMDYLYLTLGDKYTLEESYALYYGCLTKTNSKKEMDRCLGL